MKRILCLMLMLAMLVPLLAACSSGEKLTLFKDGSCEIVYDPDTTESANVKRLGEAITKVTGIEPKITTEVSEETDIFVGMVDHEDARAATADLRINDYVAGVFGEHYVIASPTPAITGRAINYFIKEVLPLTDGKLKLHSSDNYRYSGMYSINDVTVCGLTLDRHSIVIPEKYGINELYTAVVLQQLLKDKTGYDLPIVTSDLAQTEGQIRIGASICEKARATADHGYAVVGNGTALEMVASSYLGWQGLQSHLESEIFVSGKPCVLDSTTSIEGNNRDGGTASLEAQGDLRILFSNIWGVNSYRGETTPMAPRADMLVELYLTYMPDVLGFQEYKPAVAATGLIERLVDAGYKRVEMPADAATDEGSDATPLVYNPATVELLRKGYFRFDDLTYNEYPSLLGGQSAATVKSRCADGSKGFDWAIFRKKGTGEVFLVASVHLWHVNGAAATSADDPDAAARRIQIQAMKDELARAAADFAEGKGLSAETLPILVGGDYNCRAQSGSPLQQMSAVTDADGADSTFVDANTVADTKLTTTTCHNVPEYVQGWDIKGIFERDPGLGLYWNAQPRDGSYSVALDHIFLNAAGQSMISVSRLGILSDQYALLSSDHHPIYVDVSFAADCPVYTGTV